MKKNLILAAVAVLAVGQVAHAAGGEGKDKSEGARAADTKKAADEAAKTGHGAAAAGHSPLDAVKAAKLDSKLDADEKVDLGKAIAASSVVKTAVETAIKMAKDNSALQPLATEIVAALARTEGIDMNMSIEDANGAVVLGSPKAIAEQAYRSLVVDAATAAKDWTPELRDNLTFLLERINEIRAKDPKKAIADVMNEANADLAKEKKVKLNLADVTKFCRKKA